MPVNAQRAPRPAAVALAAALLLASIGCASKRRGGDAQGVSIISGTLPLASYVKARAHGRPQEGTMLFFPQLEVYDELGDLIYSSHEPIENAQILRELPGGIQGLRPKPGTPPLAEIMEAVPAFRAQEEQIIGRRKITVLSAFLEDCPACTVQEDALAGAEHRLLDHGINLLVIRVSGR